MPRQLTSKEIQSFYSQFLTKDLKILKYQNFGLGVQVQKNFSEGSVVMCIDRSSKLNPLSHYELTEHVSLLPELTQLKIKVLYYKFIGPIDNIYTNYIDSLSLDYFHIGTWSRSEISYLESVRLHDIDKEDLYGTNELNQIKRALSRVIKVPREMLEYESYMWASFAVTSRFFNYEFSDGSMPVMLPFLDLPNHYPNPKRFRNNGFFMKDAKEDCLRTFRNLEKNDEFRFDYGEHDSLTFLLEYGMVVEKNPKDFFYLFLDQDLPEGVEDGWFKCFADSVNYQLVRSLTFAYGNEISFRNLRKEWKGLDGSQYEVVLALLDYRNMIDEQINQWESSLRQVRRDLPTQETFVMKMINKYAIVARETYFFHLIALDKEILFALFQEMNIGKA